RINPQMNTDKHGFFYHKYRLYIHIIFILSVFICVHLWLNLPVSAQNTPCKFDEKTLQFAGSGVEQARCLLRPNKIGGVLDIELKKLPRPLETLIGETVKIKRENL